MCKGNYQEFENRRAELQVTYGKSFKHHIYIYIYIVRVCVRERVLS